MRPTRNLRMFITILNIYIALPVIICGIAGNLVSIIVLGRDKFVKKTTGYLLQMLALADLIFLLTCLFLQPLYTMQRYTDLMPKLREYWVYLDPFLLPCVCIAQFSAAYMVVLVTADRYIAVCNPLHVQYLSVKSRLRKYVALLWIIAILYNLPRFFEKRLVFHSDTSIESVPTPLRESKYYIVIYLTIMYFLFRFLLPCLCLVFINYRLIMEIRESIKRHHHSSSEKYTRTLVVVALVFLLSETPDFCLRIYYMITQLSDHIKEAYPTIGYLNEISNFFHTLNSSVNFVIYCFLGRRFRHILKRMISCRHCSATRKPPSTAMVAL